jgi:hypothetical protein
MAQSALARSLGLSLVYALSQVFGGGNGIQGQGRFDEKLAATVICL